MSFEHPLNNKEELADFVCLFGLALIINVSQEEIFKTRHGVDYMDFREENSV